MCREESAKPQQRSLEVAASEAQWTLQGRRRRKMGSFLVDTRMTNAHIYHSRLVISMPFGMPSTEEHALGIPFYFPCIHTYTQDGSIYCLLLASTLAATTRMWYVAHTDACIRETQRLRRRAPL